MILLEKLQAVEDKYRELESLLADPAVIADVPRWQAYSKEHAELAPIVGKYREYRKLEQEIASDKAMFSEPLDEEQRRRILVIAGKCPVHRAIAGETVLADLFGNQPKRQGRAS